MKRKNAIVVGINFGVWVIENELLKKPGSDFFNLYAVCDINKEKTDSIAEKYGVKAYYDIDTALCDEQIDVFVLITGPNGRAKLIDKIISRGKPVMTTKPFDISADETFFVLKKAESLNIPVFMNSPTPVAAGELQQVSEWITRFNLGRPIGYRASTYCSYREKPDGSWYDDPALCPAAPVFRLGIYLLNDLCRFLSPVKTVNVLQSRIFTERPTADNAMLSTLHEDGTIGSIYASFCIDDLQYYRGSFEIMFEKGTIYKNAGAKETEDIVLELAANVGGSLTVERAAIDGSISGYQWENLYRAMQGEDIGERVTPEAVASVIRIIEQMKAGSM